MAATSSPNMNLPVPAVGNTSGPEYATDINSCMSTIDQHNHTAGSGVPITVEAISISSPLPFNNNFATSLAGLTLSSQASAPAKATVYQGADGFLYYTDGTSGTAIQITNASSVNSGAGSISGITGTASASFNTDTFTWNSATSTRANMDFGAAVLRNLTPNSTFGLTLQPPAALAANYNITLPSNPGLLAGTSFMTLTTSGVMTTSIPISQGISGGMMVNGTVTATQIATGTITGTQCAANINLPGNTVQENGKNVVVSNTNAVASLSIVRGYCNSSAIIVSGEGFSITKNSTGNYGILFTTAFQDTPAVTGNCISTSGIGLTSVMIIGLGQGGFTLLTYGPASTLINIDFAFTCIGQRV